MVKYISKKDKFKLLPYEMEEIFSIQAVKQQLGWQLTSFNIPEIWKHSRGEGVRIAVIDTGVFCHDDFKKNIVDETNLLGRGYPIDENSHATSIIGIIAAENNEIGIVGVAPDSKIIPIKAIDADGNGKIKIVAKAIYAAIDLNADFIVMSLGIPKPINEVRTAIIKAANRGIVTFVAAGNMGRSKEILYPANYPETIAVGSIDPDFNRSTFSNTGNNLDFLAPGRKILSTVPNNWYAVFDGTSQACPWLAGIAALMLSYSRSKNNILKLNCAEDYRNILKQYTFNVKDKSMNKKFFEGYGIIDTKRLIREIYNK